MSSNENTQESTDKTEKVPQLAALRGKKSPDHLEGNVANIIRQRSRGRFFGRKFFSDRVPIEWIGLGLLIVGLIVLVLMRASDTGSLKKTDPAVKPPSVIEETQKPK